MSDIPYEGETLSRSSPNPFGRVRSAALTAISTFAVVVSAFGAYAWLVPATYRATAKVQLVPPASSPQLPAPVEAAQRVQEALLTPQLLDRLANERAARTSEEGRAARVRGARAAVEIETADGRNFDVSYSDSEPARAEQRANELAKAVVEQLPRLFTPEVAAEERERQAARQRRADELVAFVAAHPEVTAEPAPAPVADPRGPNEANDPVMQSLRLERSKLEARMNSFRVDPPPSADNPYADPSSVDPDYPLLRERLSKVNAAIQARRGALRGAKAPAVAKPAVPSALRAQYLALVQAAAEANATVTPPPVVAAAPTARLVESAALPSSPVDPDRGRLLRFGLSLGLIAGALAALIRSALSRGASAESSFGMGTQPTEANIRNELDLMSNEESGTDGGKDPVSSKPPIDRQTPVPSSPRDFVDSETFPISQRPNSSSVRVGPIVEVNAPVASAESRREPAPRETSGVELTESAAKLPPGRTTQVLGSPIPPAPPTGFGPTPYPYQRPAQRNASPSGTGYSYVSTPPPPRGPSSHPPRSIGSAAPSGSSSASAGRGPSSSGNPPTSEPRRISHAPNPASARPSQPPVTDNVVAPQPAPQGWRPDASLSPESRRELRDALYPLAVQQCFVIAVAGVRAAADDTGRVASEVALALAETEHPRILLLEGNLQRPSVHRFMQIEMPLFAGFSEQLEARLQAGPERGPWNVLACSPSLHVLAEGVMRIPELILSRQFEDCVLELRQYYDVIVIAGPLVSEIAASRAVQDVVDGVVLVCPSGATSEIAEASALFSQKRFSTVLATG